MMCASYANRGKWLEEAVLACAQLARRRGEAVIEKIATPYVLPRAGANGRSTMIRKRSSVDFLGSVFGHPVAFDAKAVTGQRLPIANVKRHQVEFLTDFARTGGVACLLVAFGSSHVFLADVAWWRLRCRDADRSGRKSIRVEVFAGAPPEMVACVPRARGYALDVPGAVAALALANGRDSVVVSS